MIEERKLKCTNKACGHEWNYKGSMNKGQYACCPRCLYRIRIMEDKVSELQKTE